MTITERIANCKDDDRVIIVRKMDKAGSTDVYTVRELREVSGDVFRQPGVDWMRVDEGNEQESV